MTAKPTRWPLPPQGTVPGCMYATGRGIVSRVGLEQGVVGMNMGFAGKGIAMSGIAVANIASASWDQAQV